MYQNYEQNLCQSQLYLTIKGEGQIDSQDSISECRVFSNSNTVDKFVISDDSTRLILIEEKQNIIQWRLKIYKKEFTFKPYGRTFEIHDILYAKNKNQFYIYNRRVQVKFLSINNGKIKQIWSIKNDSLYFIRQIKVVDNEFILIAIPNQIKKYNIFTKQYLQNYLIDNSYFQNCFDYCQRQRILVSQDQKAIKCWFMEQNSIITKQFYIPFYTNKLIKINNRQIFKLIQKACDSQLIISIYQITQDDKEIQLVKSIGIDNIIQYECMVQLMEDIYPVFQNLNFIKQDCINFQIQKINRQLNQLLRQFKYLVVVKQKIIIRTKNSNHITSEFMRVI